MFILTSVNTHAVLQIITSPQTHLITVIIIQLFTQTCTHSHSEQCVKGAESYFKR